jgi:hypothetical protein
MIGTIALLSLTSFLSPWAEAPAESAPVEVIEATVRPNFDTTISTVEGMTWNPKAQRLAKKHGLSLVNVTWEDTGRNKGSSWGPNISDMTIGVRDDSGQLHPMPVFRFDNFNDKTADIKADSMFIRTGNEDGEPLEPTKLVDLLANVQDYLSRDSGRVSNEGSLLNARDTHFLVSAQACFLPIPKNGEATFTPVIYNYQSRAGNPAVMTIVATREGTSVQVVENDSGYMSETLFFNQKGERAPFTATRLSDFKAQGGDKTSPGNQATKDAGLDVVLVIQVPLKHRAILRKSMSYAPEMEEGAGSGMMPTPSSAKSNVEQAVIGHGEVEGPFKELNGLSIERDPRFPVRVTAQFYKATSNGVVSDADVADIRKQIDKVYASGDYVGSLVSEGFTNRPTESAKPQHQGLWARPIWQWHKAN